MVLINILLVDDHVLFAKSLSIALEEYSEVGELITTQSIENLGQYRINATIRIIQQVPNKNCG